MSSPDPSTNGVEPHTDDHDAPKTGEERIAQLEQELEKTRAESDNWAEQYRTLLAKLTTMRTTLANKLQQDAVSESELFEFNNSPNTLLAGRTR